MKICPKEQLRDFDYWNNELDISYKSERHDEEFRNYVNEVFYRFENTYMEGKYGFSPFSRNPANK